MYMYLCHECREFSVAPVVMKINDEDSLCRQLFTGNLSFPTFRLDALGRRIRASNRNVSKVQCKFLVNSCLQRESSSFHTYVMYMILYIYMYSKNI